MYCAPPYFLWLGATAVAHGPRTIGDFVHLLVGLVGYGYVVWFVVQRFALRCTPEYLLITAGGLEWQVRGRARKTIPRMEITDVRLAEDGEAVVVVSSNPDHTWPIPAAFIPKKSSFAAFQAIVVKGLGLSEE